MYGTVLQKIPPASKDSFLPETEQTHCRGVGAQAWSVGACDSRIALTWARSLGRWTAAWPSSRCSKGMKKAKVLG